MRFHHWMMFIILTLFLTAWSAAQTRQPDAHRDERLTNGTVPPQPLMDAVNFSSEPALLLQFPEGEVQVPDTQLFPPPHFTPQAPQLLGSDERSEV